MLSPTQTGAEHLVVNLVLWLKLGVELVGALIIAVGVVIALYRFGQGWYRHALHDFGLIRLTLARYLALALEFQLGADILSTAVSPSWDQIGKLGAIAVLRTALNYSLTREMREEGHAPAAPAPGDAPQAPAPPPEGR